MSYISTTLSNTLSIIFIVYIICVTGYYIGAFQIKGISLGTAGVLLTALIYGMISSYIPEITIGGRLIVLFDDALKSKFSILSSIGTSMFVTAVGLIAGPKFFRTFSRKTMAYIWMGIIIIVLGSVVTVACICIDGNMSPSMAVGLMAGALTSTPGLSAAKETIGAVADFVTAGYGIAYLFGVLGVVFFVQLVPKLLKVDLAEERKNYVAANTVDIPEFRRSVRALDPLGFFPFMLAIALGCFIGALYIPGINFSLGNSGGCLVSGLLIGHLQHIGKIDLRVEKRTLNFFRELGLVFFLVGAGVPGGVNFIENVKPAYFVYGALITLIPMVVGYYVARYIFKLNLFNALGSITGGMTSTPALGALISTAGTDEVASAYAATYPIALVCVVIASKLIIMFAII